MWNISQHSSTLVDLPRVLMAVPQYPYPVVGGLERQAHELSKALIRLGVSVQVVSGTVVGMTGGTEKVEGIDVYRCPWGENKLIRFLKTAVCIASTMYRRRLTYDVVHLHNVSSFGALVITIAKLLRKPILYKLPNVGRVGIPGMRRRFLGSLLVTALKRSDAVVAMSDTSIEELRQIHYPASRILKMTNGVATETFHPVSRGSKAQEPVNIAFCGRLTTTKGIADLISIWPQVVQQSRVPVVLHIYGSGPEEGRLRQMVEDQQMDVSVSFDGYQSNINHVLRSADMFVLPSYAEGNSNAILEAMATELPIISTRVGGTCLLVGDEGASYIVNPGDTEGIKNCIITLANNEGARGRLGSDMLARVQRHFTIDVVARRYVEAYELLVSGKRDHICTISSPVFGLD